MICGFSTAWVLQTHLLFKGQLHCLREYTNWHKQNVGRNIEGAIG